MAETKTATEAPDEGGKVFITKVPLPGPTALGVNAKVDSDGRIASVAWAKTGDEIELPFDKPFPQRSPMELQQAGIKFLKLYTVKAIKPDGTMVQIPLDDQVNNGAGAPGQLVNLTMHRAKGYNLLFDFESRTGVYCPTGNCYAPWDNAFEGFCCAEHRKLSKPESNPGRFGEGATTSQSAWRRG